MTSAGPLMKNDRLGDWLWEEWDGTGLESDSDLVYITSGWIDINNEIVRRALASCLQRDGVAESLSDGFRLIENSSIIKTYAGYNESEKYLTLCNDTGESDLGDMLDDISEITLIEL